MAGVFISYRREDSAGHAGRLVMFPKKKLPTIADLARDRVTRIQAAKKDCFQS